jgi:MinD-like ATPase involved in chromosome partitioning or flagellar assembly
MKAIGVVRRQGGVGKMTLAIRMALLAHQSGRRALLVDPNPQRNAAV